MRRHGSIGFAGLACMAAASLGVRVLPEGEPIIPTGKKPEPKLHSNAREIARRQRQKERAAEKAKRKQPA